MEKPALLHDVKPAVLGRKFCKFDVNPNEFMFRGLELDARSAPGVDAALS
jgi:hypothetical protein